MVDRVDVPVEDGLQDPTNNTSPDNTDGDLILGKFKSYEDLEKSYQALEKKLGQPKAEAPKADEEGLPETKPEADDDWYPEGDTPDVNTILPGFSEEKVNEISQYAWENRELTEDHYSELEKAGYSRDIVDQFMAGQFAQQDAQVSQLINAGGGEEKVSQMFEWAEANLSSDQVDAYNERFDRGGADAIMAMEHLAGKYQESGMGSESLVRGANAPLNQGAAPYTSVDQVRQDMSDPRYHNDPAFRDEVARRLAVSNVL